MGDEYWKPDILLTTWNQADNGKSPRLGRRLPRALPRPGLRLHLDRHVGDRPPHPRRHPRTRIHLHLGGHRHQAYASAASPPTAVCSLRLRALWSCSSRPSWTCRAGPWRVATSGRGPGRGGRAAEDPGGDDGRRGLPGAGRATRVGACPWSAKPKPRATGSCSTKCVMAQIADRRPRPAGRPCPQVAGTPTRGCWSPSAWNSAPTVPTASSN